MSSSRSASNSRSTSASGGMKQGRLEFPSSRRTTSTAGVKKGATKVKGGFVPGIGKPAGSRVADIDIEGNEQKEGGTEVVSRAIIAHEDSQVPTQQDTVENIKSPEAPLELNIKDPRWKKLFTDAKAKRSGLPLIHGKDQNQVHQILRVFDLNYDYGPCIGVTRMERWERAHALGLKPPVEIRDILLTREGLEQRGYSESVFYGEV